MLELTLKLQNNRVTVYSNGKESHHFSLLDLIQSKEEWKDFFENPRAYGEKLFNALFRDVAMVEFDSMSKQPERTVVLVLESSELNSVAWEYVYNKAKEEYVVEDCAFVRALPEKERPVNGRMKNEVERVPLLFIPANPLVDLSGEPMLPLDEEKEWQKIEGFIEKSNAPFDMLELKPATPEALQSVMARFQNGMIAHFSGHGAATKDGALLLFEHENGASNPLDAREFVRDIKDKAWIGFLSACQSAVLERTEFSNLARELVKAGVPFALGMQFNLPDSFTPDISGQFYNYLAHGHTVPEAARQARRAVKRENEFFVGLIALYASHPDGVGKLAWRSTGAQTVRLFHPADVSDLPAPASGLIGRQSELMRIGTHLFEGRKPLTVTLHGVGGIGKTALLRHVLQRFAPSFELTLAIRLDPLPSLESVLGRIERFMDLPSPCANDTKERETLVRNTLTSKHTLLGLDNFETLNYALNENGSDAEKTAKSLHNFFKNLAANDVTLCVTSREVTNLPGETIEDIQGLTNESGGRLFQGNIVKQKDEIYIEKTQQVSEMVGGHPLALRLLASGFDDQVGTSLDQYIESLQSFLPKAHDKWTEEDRHKSLRASFDFTMRSLVKTDEGKSMQIALSRLSIFIGFFDPLFTASVIANKWNETKGEKVQQHEAARKISHALWSKGLLERIAITLSDDGTYNLYRLHPTLSIFANEQLIDAESVKEIYKKSMIDFALIAEKQFTKDPLIAQISLYALADLQFVAENWNDEDTAVLQFITCKFLQMFGSYDNTLKVLQKSKSNFEKFSDKRGVAATITLKASVLFTRGDLDESLSAYEYARTLFQELNDQQGIGVVLGGIAQIQLLKGHVDESLKLNEEKLLYTRNSGDKYEEGSVLSEIGKIHLLRNNLDLALQVLNKSLEILKDAGDLHGTSVVRQSIANVYVLQGKFDEARSLYNQSLQIREKFGDVKGKAEILHELANVSFELGITNDAITLYNESMQIDKKLGNPKGESATLHNLAGVYAEVGDFEKALSLYNQSYSIKRKLDDVIGAANTLSQMARIYLWTGNYSLSIRCYFSSLDFYLLTPLDDRAKAIIYLLINIRQIIGQQFDDIWISEIKKPEIIKAYKFKDFVQPLFLIEFVNKSIKLNSPATEDLFRFMQKLQNADDIPSDLRNLGRVLLRIIVGDRNVDLSSLPKEWAGRIRKMIETNS